MIYDDPAEREILRQCHTRKGKPKMVFDSKVDADLFLLSTKRQELQYAYQCWYGHWHLASYKEYEKTTFIRHSGFAGVAVIPPPEDRSEATDIGDSVLVQPRVVRHRHGFWGALHRALTHLRDALFTPGLQGPYSTDCWTPSTMVMVSRERPWPVFRESDY